MLLLGTDLTTNFVQALSICLLTVSFSLFLLILSFVYINENIFIELCDFENTENARKVEYSESNFDMIDERDTSDMIVNGFTENSYLNFFPDVHDIEIIDEKIDFLEPLKLMEPEPQTIKNTEAVGKIYSSLYFVLKKKLEGNFYK